MKTVQHITLFAIYHEPIDVPAPWALRRWRVSPDQGVIPDSIVCLSDTLEALREGIAGLSLTRFARQPDDDPALYEVWI